MTKLNSIFLFVMMIGVVTINFMACKEPPPVDPPPVEPPDTTQYFLENTKWKLIAFVDNENNTSRPPLNVWNIVDTDPYFYIIYFRDSSQNTTDADVLPFVSHTDCNGILGCYTVNYNNSTIQRYEIVMSAVYCLFDTDEDNYWTGLYYAQEFEITINHLKIFYNNRKNYLWFERRAE